MTGHSLNVLKLSTVSGSFLAIEVSTRVIYHQAVFDDQRSISYKTTKQHFASFCPYAAVRQFRPRL